MKHPFGRTVYTGTCVQQRTTRHQLINGYVNTLSTSWRSVKIQRVNKQLDGRRRLLFKSGRHCTAKCNLFFHAIYCYYRDVPSCSNLQQQASIFLFQFSSTTVCAIFRCRCYWRLKFKQTNVLTVGPTTFRPTMVPMKPGITAHCNIYKSPDTQSVQKDSKPIVSRRIADNKYPNCENLDDQNPGPVHLQEIRKLVTKWCCSKRQHFATNEINNLHLEPIDVLKTKNKKNE